MKKQIIINASQDRSRIAIVEDGELVELYVENPDNVRTIGNIYLGKVEKVMPTLRAAFVDIGEKQDAFLHFSDLTDNFPQLLKMSGEDVPGLEEPMLALAPQKRIADDESEPDIEDTLEVESAQDDDAESPSRSRSTRRRRSRGRGRSSETTQEEEEQEEQPKRPRGMAVLDLTTKPKARAAAPAPPAPKAEAPAETKTHAPAETPAAATPAATPAEAPRSRRAPRTPRTAADLPPSDAEDAPNAASAPGPETTPDAEAPKKPRRARAKKKTSDAPVEAADAEAPASEQTPVETPPAAEMAGEPTRSRRGRKTDDAPRTEQAEAPAEDAAAENATAEAAETPAARPRRAPRNRPTRDAVAAPKAAAPKADPAPSATAETPGAEETTPAAQEDRSRSRRRTRGDADAPEQAPSHAAEAPATEAPATEAPAAEAPAAEAPAEAPKRPRGMAVLDLSSSARPKPAPRPEPSRPEPAAEMEDEAPRSRRSTRRDDEATADAHETTPSAEPSDGTAEDRPRSRRRGRGSNDDARPTDEAPRNEARRDEPTNADEADSDEAPARGRRQTRETSGREAPSQSDASTSDASTSDAGREARGRRDDARPASPRAPGARRVPVPSNEQLLRRDGHVIVKITKEPISAKGSRVSTDISLAGRFLVLVPAADYVAVSKKIESAKERKRLRTLAQSLKPDNCGVIVRTVAEGRDAKSLDTDLRLLIDKWRSIEAKLDGGKAKAPILLYEDVNMVSSIIRDLFSEDFDRILVDDPKTFKNVQAYVKAVAPDMADKVELHRAATPVFRSVGIEKQVEEAFSRRVNMKGGGYLFIETTEAMHVVDVNSGRAGRGKSQKENMIAVNVEAAREVAKQLRLRDLGGIIVVDFIDLRLEGDRRKVTNVLKEAFEKDRAVTKLLPMSDFGLVQITRQRLRPSITAQPEGDEPGADPAERAARAGAGEIAQATDGRGSRDDRSRDSRGGRDADARPSRELDTIEETPDERPEPRERSREARTDRARRPARDTARDASRAEPEERPEPAVSPESATALLRAWLDGYRKSVEEPYRDRPIVVRVHPLFLTHLQRGLFSTLTRWRLSVRNIPWRIEEDAALDPLAFDVRDEKSGRSLLRKYTL